jgi:hypothetical protein
MNFESRIDNYSSNMFGSLLIATETQREVINYITITATFLSACFFVAKYFKKKCFGALVILILLSENFLVKLKLCVQWCSWKESRRVCSSFQLQIRLVFQIIQNLNELLTNRLVSKYHHNSSSSIPKAFIFRPKHQNALLFVILHNFSIREKNVHGANCFPSSFKRM